mmetsp:Transcript_50131/g.144440  ORF Transcript_50131/g.144440 Transcript_50131/m.144440 type:complete len:625 (-) Transcript_50131:114-1988(-)
MRFATSAPLWAVGLAPLALSSTSAGHSEALPSFEVQTPDAVASPLAMSTGPNVDEGGRAIPESTEAGPREGKAEGGEEGEEEEEEEGFTAFDINSGCTLLGGVTFVMALFQLVNVQDDDVRRYAWRVVSNTVSIFMAVLFFSGANEMLVHCSKVYLGVGDASLSVIQFLHCLVYIAGMFLSVALCFGVFGQAVNFDREEWTIADANLHNFEEVVPNPHQTVRACLNGDYNATKSIMVDEFGLEVAVVKKHVELDQALRRSVAWSTLLAHMGGFAAIAAGGSLQQTVFRSTPVLAFLPVLIVAGALLCIFQVSRYIRAMIRAEFIAKGYKNRKAIALVRETVSEAEEDTLALAISFLLTQAVRFAISGQLPNAEGIDEPLRFAPAWTHIARICLAGSLFVFSSIVLTAVRTSVSGGEGAEEEGGEEEEPMLVSILDVCVHACAMASAWCTFFGSRWVWIMLKPFGMNVLSVNARILLALAVSFGSFAVVYGLDKIDDNFRSTTGGKAIGRTIASVVGAVSVLVGFSWEHSFDGAVQSVVLLSASHRRSAEFILGIAVFLVILRPWRKFILKRAMQLDDLKKARDKTSREKELMCQYELLRQPYHQQYLQPPFATEQPNCNLCCCT